MIGVTQHAFISVITLKSSDKISSIMEDFFVVEKDLTAKVISVSRTF